MTKAERAEIARAKKAAARAASVAKKAAAAAARADKRHLALVAREHAKAERAKLAALKREAGPRSHTFTVWVGNDAKIFRAARPAMARYYRAQRQGLPVSIYVDGDCAGSENGDGSRIDPDADALLSRLLRA